MIDPDDLERLNNLKARLAVPVPSSVVVPTPRELAERQTARYAGDVDRLLAEIVTAMERSDDPGVHQINLTPKPDVATLPGPVRRLLVERMRRSGWSLTFTGNWSVRITETDTDRFAGP